MPPPFFEEKMMQLHFTVLQVLAVGPTRERRDHTTTHIQVGMQTADGDNSCNLTLPLDKAKEFVVGSTIIVTVGGGLH